MDRDRCIFLLSKALIPEKGGLSSEETKEVLTDYVCDRGYSDKKDYIPLLMVWYSDWSHLLNCAFDYYKTFFNICTIEKLPTPNDLMGRRQVIYIY